MGDKNEYFWGMQILWIFLGVITKLLVLGVISVHFRVFSLGQCIEWRYIYFFFFLGGGVIKISNNFLGYTWYSLFLFIYLFFFFFW